MYKITVKFMYSLYSLYLKYSLKNKTNKSKKHILVAISLETLLQRKKNKQISLPIVRKRWMAASHLPAFQNGTRLTAVLTALSNLWTSQSLETKGSVEISGFLFLRKESETQSSK